MKTVDFYKDKKGQPYMQVWDNDRVIRMNYFDRICFHKPRGQDPIRFRLDTDRGIEYADKVSFYSDYSGIISLYATEATAVALEDLYYRWSME